jgi:hypothetical protein
MSLWLSSAVRSAVTKGGEPSDMLPPPWANLLTALLLSLPAVAVAPAHFVSVLMLRLLLYGLMLLYEIRDHLQGVLLCWLSLMFWEVQGRLAVAAQVGSHCPSHTS